MKNTGDWNKGKLNTGDRNLGDENTGDHNSGNKNTGNFNSGISNTGNKNSGSTNTGNQNTGDRNTGNNNLGAWNTGSFNIGGQNSGNWNIGYHNSGNWNTGNWNNGYCNSITPDECLVFNKPCKRSDWEKTQKPNWMHCDLTSWVKDTEMTEEEKDANPNYLAMGGYLKSYSSLKEAYLDSWNMATMEDQLLTEELPNFDKDVFKEVFGFEYKVDTNKKILIDGIEKEISLEDFNRIKELL